MALDVRNPPRGSGAELDNGYAEVTSNAAGITSTTGIDIPGLVITPTIGRRPVLIEVRIPQISPTTLATPPKFAGIFILESVSGGAYTIITRDMKDVTRQGGWNSLYAAVRRTPAPGAVTTWKAQAFVEAGTWTFYGQPDYPSFISCTER